MTKSFWEKMQAIDRRIIFLFMATAVIIPLLVPLNLGVNVTGRVRSIYDEIEKLEEGSPVLIAADFDPSSAPELYPMLDSAIYQCFRKNHRIVLTALWPGAKGLVVKALKDNALLFGKDFGLDYEKWKTWHETGEEFVQQEKTKGEKPDPKKKAEELKKKVAQLVEKLKDKEEDIRLYAVEALASMGAPAIEPLTDILKGKNVALQALAIQVLGRIGDAAVVEPLIKILKGENKELRLFAAEALGAIKDAKAIEPLLEAMKDADKKLCASAAQALSTLGATKAVEPLIKALKEKDEVFRSAAAKALGDIADQSSVSALEKIFKEEKGNPQIWSAYALVKIKNNKDALDFLIKALKEEDTGIRRSAAQALGAIENKTAINPLVEILKDDDSKVRSSAIEALGKIENAKAVEPLIEALKDTDMFVRSTTVKALNQIGDKRATKQLIEVLKDKSWLVRYRASVALKRITGKIVRRDYIFLGFKAGGPAVILSAGQDLKGAYENVDGKATADMPVLKDVNKLKDFKYGLALSAGAPGIEEWIIYGSEKYGFKMGAGCTGVMAAENFPYLNAGQINGLMAGLKGAAEYEWLLRDAVQKSNPAEYERLEKMKGKGFALPLMDSQAIGHLVIIAFIVLGNIAYFTTRKSKKG
jgi:HEAT repeat protein